MKIIQESEKMDLELKQAVPAKFSRIKRTLKQTPKATFLTIVSNFTWGH